MLGMVVKTQPRLGGKVKEKDVALGCRFATGRYIESHSLKSGHLYLIHHVLWNCNERATIATTA